MDRGAFLAQGLVVRFSLIVKLTWGMLPPNLTAHK